MTKQYYYLSHHGIKGQKWGVRRFQNPDGSLTSEGRKRYSAVKNAKAKPTAKGSSNGDSGSIGERVAKNTLRGVATRMAMRAARNPLRYAAKNLKAGSQMVRRSQRLSALLINQLAT